MDKIFAQVSGRLLMTILYLIHELDATPMALRGAAVQYRDVRLEITPFPRTSLPRFQLLSIIEWDIICI